MYTRYAELSEKNYIYDGIIAICNSEMHEHEPFHLLMPKIEKAIKNKEIIVADSVSSNATGIIGFVWGTIGSKIPHGIDYGYENKYCWINWTYVSPHHRHRGVATTLYRRLERDCARAGIHTMYIDSFRINKESTKFHRHFGYKTKLTIFTKKI